jgi:hypothetical protein
MRDRGVEIAEFVLRLVRGDLDEVVVVEKLRLGLGLVRSMSRRFFRSVFRWVVSVR